MPKVTKSAFNIYSEWLEIFRINFENIVEVKDRVIALITETEVNKEIAFGSDADSESDDDCFPTTYTPLILAIKNNRPDIVKILLENKADVNQTVSYIRHDFNPITPLDYVIKNHDVNLDIIKALIDAGADINVRDIPGSSSPLFKIVFAINHYTKCHAKVLNGELTYDTYENGFHMYGPPLPSLEQATKEIERGLEVLKLFLTSPKYSLEIESNDQRDLVIKVLQESPLLVPFKEPVIISKDSSGNISKRSDPEISALIEDHRINKVKVLDDIYHSFSHYEKAEHKITDPQDSINDPSVAEIILSYYMKDTQSFTLLNPDANAATSSAPSIPSELLYSAASISKNKIHHEAQSSSACKDTNKPSSASLPAYLQDEAKSDKEVISSATDNGIEEEQNKVTTASTNNGIEEEHDIGLPDPYYIIPSDPQYMEPVVHLGGEIAPPSELNATANKCCVML